MGKEKELENKDKVVISAEDANSALNFWSHYEIPLPEDLKKAVEAFSTDPNIETQNAMKLEFLKAIYSSDHPALSDDMWTKVAQECRVRAYDMTFDKDLEQSLTTEE